MSFYRYTADLLTLDLCRCPIVRIHRHLWDVHTPLNSLVWEEALRGHPDRAFSRLLVRGLRDGFRIGFCRTANLRSATRNMPSAVLHPIVINDYIEKERSLGRMLGPFPVSSASEIVHDCHINRLGVIPKGHNTGKWRVITDLSFPPGHSVNEGIDPDLCSLTYTSVDEVAAVAARYPPGALLAKIDIESAYRLVPVHPADRRLLAVEWQGAVYVDPMLPFGLRSAPKIFNAIADALEWCLRQQGIRDIFHYLDDFIIVAPPRSPECSLALKTLDRVCATLGVPIAEHKRDGPTTCITFLGIEIDTVAAQLRLPVPKLERLRALLQSWGDRKACERRELESLVGLLNHACRVVRSGRSFLRRMLDLLHGVPMHPLKPHPIRLSREFRSDLAWWRMFVAEWNGVSFLPPPKHLPTIEMASDASGSWGCGAWHGDHWFQFRWDRRSAHLSIMIKELFPIIVACAVWGSAWRGRRVICHCDNQSVVACLRSRTSRDKYCMHMLRVLAFVEAHLSFSLSPQYINTRANSLADSLSRNNLSDFLSKVPQAQRTGAQLPSPLIDLLLDPSLDWTSRHWHQRFRSTFGTASLPLLNAHTTRH